MFIICLNPWFRDGVEIVWEIGWLLLPSKFIPKLFWGEVWGGWETVGVELMPKLNPKFRGWETGWDGSWGADWGADMPNPIKSAPNPVLSIVCEGALGIEPKPNKSPPKIILDCDIGWGTGCFTEGIVVSNPKMLKGSLFCEEVTGGVETAC